MSMILVSHDLGVIAEMCDRVAVMYAGQIVELTDTETLLREPPPPLHDLAAALAARREPQTRYLRPIAGSPPPLIDVPDGCRFAPRCPIAVEECRSWQTELVQISGQAHTARCFRHEETTKEDAWQEPSYGSE